MKSVIAIAIALSAFAGVAQAQTLCADHDAAVNSLKTKYGETLIARGLDSGKRMFELFWSAESGTWTILVTPPGGLSCIVQHGTGLTRFEEAVIIPGKAA